MSAREAGAVLDSALPLRLLHRGKVRDVYDLGDRLPSMERPSIDRFTAGQKVFTGMKGSYGGLLMFGLAMTLAGMPMINPVSIGAGALFGGKSIRDESRQLLRRRLSPLSQGPGLPRHAAQRDLTEQSTPADEAAATQQLAPTDWSVVAVAHVSHQPPCPPLPLLRPQPLLLGSSLLPSNRLRSLERDSPIAVT